ncbi:hypothetical protein [Sinomicrobium oceani]|uniref:hypothetical protein n=1 Tax=Sinomicrobium oceani TaxID=1150368 RepID=UPI00227AF565|nr:hypothetical protein [Sinomicrobium oceani]
MYCKIPQYIVRLCCLILFAVFANTGQSLLAQQAGKRVYADGQANGGTILLSNVSNPGRAADGDKDTYSTMTLTAIGEVWQKLNFTTQQPSPDDPVHIKIGTNTGLLSLLSGLTLQAYIDNTAIGDPITLGSLIGLLNGADQADIVLPAPGVAYNSVRVRSAGIALGGGG